ncbi:MAG TPA: hypothetical protein VIV60_36705, partial [Polyangiaceae bacterium]
DATSGLELHIRESVAENAYLDEAKLILVDHPEGSEIWSSGDESTNEWGYVAPFRVYSGTAPRVPIAATDRSGRDVLPSVLAQDNQPAPVEPGTVENDYTFDFGEILSPENAKLIFDGWSVYLYRAPLDVQPFIEAETSDGNWVTVTKFGAPYGDLKSVAVDLGGKLPEHARRLRVHLGLEQGARWVIDRVRFDESAPVELEMLELEPTRADLMHRGRATLNRATIRSRQDALDDESPDEPRQYGYGAYTRYGDIRELLTSTDDRYAIFRHGDQISFKFPGAKAPKSGWVRSVILKVNVLMKTFYFSNTVEPLPFRGMTAYPYDDSETYPTDLLHRSYLNEFNTRIYSPTDAQGQP